MKDAYYFSHDSNARNDTKILTMRCDYGLEGYGMYWIIIEVLRDEGEYRLKYDDSTFKALAMQMHCKVDAIKSFIEKCINEYELFCNDESYFWSDSLLRRMNKLEEVREKRKQAANKRWNQQVDANGMQMHSNSNASDVQNDAKESKVKESKVSIYSDSFTETLKLYPGKKIKSIRDKKLPNIVNEYSEEQIKRCIERYSNEVKDKDKQYIMNESTFWNGRFKDYLDEDFQDEEIKKPKKKIEPKFVFRDL